MHTWGWEPQEVAGLKITTLPVGIVIFAAGSWPLCLLCGLLLLILTSCLGVLHMNRRAGAAQEARALNNATVPYGIAIFAGASCSPGRVSGL